MLTVKQNQKQQHINQSSTNQKSSILNKPQQIRNKRGNSQSSSKSQSISCEAGCPRRSALLPKDKKKTKIPKKLTIDHYDKLFCAIEQFHGNLSSMSLDLLLTHTNPQQWVTQQYQTHRQLYNKLSTIRDKCLMMVSYGRNSYHTEQLINSTPCSITTDKSSILRNVEYYQSKLQAVKAILENIQSNMGLLGKLHEPQSQRDINSNKWQTSTDTVIKKNQLTDNLIQSRNSQHNNYSSSHPDSHQLSVNKSQKKYSSNISFNSSQKKSNSIEKGIKKWEQLIQLENSNNTEKNHSYCKKCSPQQQQKQSNDKKLTITNNNDYTKHLKQFRRITNPSNQPTHHQTQTFQFLHPSQTPLFSTYKTQNKQNFMQQPQKQYHDEIWSSVNEANQTQSNRRSTKKQNSSKIQTKRIKNIQYPNINQHDIQPHNKLQNLINIFTTFMKDQQTLTTDRAQKVPPSNITYSKQLKNKYLSPDHQQQQLNLTQIKPLLLELSQLKSEIKNKNEQIEKFMIMQQQYEIIVQLLNKKYKQVEEDNQLTNKQITHLTQLNKQYKQQMATLLQSDKQMKDILKNQVLFLNIQQKQKQQAENKIKLQLHTNSKIEKQTQDTINNLKKQLQNCQNNEKISTQKMQIYKQKYYKILHQNQLKKLITEQTYNGKTDKIKQIWNILAQHKRSLQSIDQLHRQKNKINATQYLNKNCIIKKQYMLDSPTENVSDQQQEKENRRKIPHGIQSPLINQQTMSQWKISQY